jgi:deoxyadenosine/deoxycytidine kinase
MIIIINGSLGVGKTTLSDELLWKLDNTIMLDGDALGNVNPFDIYDQKRIWHLYKTIELLAAFHKKSGFKNIIINYVFESSQSLNELINLLKPIDDLIFVYWITCEKDVQEQRIKNRKRENIEWELNRFLELQEIQRKASTMGFIGKEINSTHKTISEMANTIIEEIKIKEI